MKKILDKVKTKVLEGINLLPRKGNPFGNGWADYLCGQI